MSDIEVERGPMDPITGAEERVEIEVDRDTAKATLYLADKPVMTIKIGCVVDNWASGTEGLIYALEMLAYRLRVEAPGRGIQIRNLIRGEAAKA